MDELEIMEEDHSLEVFLAGVVKAEDLNTTYDLDPEWDEYDN